MTEKKVNEKEIHETKSNNNEKDQMDQISNSDKETEEKDQSKKKYIFNCTKCGQCCEKRETVPLSLADIRSWSKSGIFNAVYPHIKIKTFQTDNKNQFIALVLEGTEKGCPLFDQENRLCNIYHSMPLECKAFPLGFNGQNYYIKDKTVPGLGQGTMTKERLIEDRDNAREDFEARLDTQILLPLLYSAFMQNIIEQQQQIMEEMPQEKREQLEELLKKPKSDTK